MSSVNREENRQGELALMSKQLTSLQDRLAAWADEDRERAATTAPGPEQDAFHQKIEQADKATKLCNWINSPELQPPK